MLDWLKENWAAVLIIMLLAAAMTQCEARVQIMIEDEPHAATGVVV